MKNIQQCLSELIGCCHLRKWIVMWEKLDCISYSDIPCRWDVTAKRSILLHNRSYVVAKFNIVSQ